MAKLTHMDKDGNSTMVNVTSKPLLHRRAVAEGWVLMTAETMDLIASQNIAKGNVLSVAQLAGIQGSKQTSQIIPLCHPIPIDSVDVDVQLQEKGVYIQATVCNVWKTGVEMEALTAVMSAALTVYDMLKAVDSTMVIMDVKLLSKTKSIPV